MKDTEVFTFFGLLAIFVIVIVFISIEDYTHGGIAFIGELIFIKLIID